MALPRTKSAWLFFAITSGACAACNGVFAKLTTTELTSSWSSHISMALGLGASSTFVEYAIRALFFGLNLLFNAIMWGLFTRALTLASSTVRVSVINTSANFVVTAVLSALIFAEELPGLWWLGAAMLVVGSVVIGMREEGEKAGEGESEARFQGEREGAAPLLGGEGDEDDEDERVELERIKGRERDGESSDEDAVLK